MENSRIETPVMQQLRSILERRHLAHWWPILSQWLPHFDGWLAAMEVDPACETDDTTAQEIVDRLQLYPRHTTIDDLQFAKDVSQCDFLYRCARLCRSRRRWNAMTEPYREFSRQEPDQVPDVYEYQSSERVWYYWLLGRLYEIQLHAGHDGGVQLVQS